MLATLEPARFVRSIAAMMASQVPGYAARLEEPEIKNALDFEACSIDPFNGFEAGVLTPLQGEPPRHVRRPFLGNDGVMSGGSSRRYPAELRERAVRMVAEISDQRDSEWAAISEVARLLGVGCAETVRKWVHQA